MDRSNETGVLDVTTCIEIVQTDQLDVRLVFHTPVGPLQAESSGCPTHPFRDRLACQLEHPCEEVVDDVPEFTHDLTKYLLEYFAPDSLDVPQREVDDSSLAFGQGVEPDPLPYRFPSQLRKLIQHDWMHTCLVLFLRVFAILI